MNESRRLFPGRTKPAPTCPVTLAVNRQTAKLERRFIANEIEPALSDIDDKQRDRYGVDD
ncbi:unnamed protein product [marine sediment metagenome]|uniref:Uncharacterized protein n=1 Tax=marine sediment metagenome TaxID=412755 RepID=X1MHZ9_9ZZZZ